jgi:hypothetical protein
MRHSNGIGRVFALATITALVGGTVGIGGSALARDLSSNPNAGRDGLSAGGGQGSLTRSGNRGTINPKKLPNRLADPMQRPVKPVLSRAASTATSPAPKAPTGFPVAPDPVEVTTTGNPPAGRPGDEGLAYAVSTATDFQPADPWVAVGPDHVIQTVNSAMQILDRSGNLIESHTMADFFDLPAGYGSANPRVIFDSLHQRWVMTELSWICLDAGGGYGYVDYLISSTADPTDPWRLAYIQWTNHFPDFPAPGTSTVNLSFGVNVWHMNTTPGSNCLLGGDLEYIGTHMLFTDWAEVLRPPTAPVSHISEWSTPPEYFTARIAVQVPATSATSHVVYQFDEGADGVGPINARYATFAGLASDDSLVPITVNQLAEEGVVAPWVDPPPHPQQPPPDTEVTPDIDSRPTDAIWQSNKLTWVSTDGCTPTGDLSLQDCVRVTQIDTSVFDVPQSVQDFWIADADVDHYVGGIGQALDGTLHVVWTRSSASKAPSSYAAYQLRGDPDNSLSAPELLRAASPNSSFQGEAWGGYVGVAQDPQVPNAVWQGNAYSGGGFTWKTFISRLQTGGSSYVPIPPVRVLDTRPAYQIGLSGAFQANNPRTFAVGGSFTIPANAIAVTGNVTIANQTGAGYLSVTPSANANPTSSTINFPLGDTRANNLTVPLATNGKLAAVYKAQAGKTTHLIVDITGYFLAGDQDATYSTLPPVRVLDSRIGTGLTGTFKTDIPRKLQITGASGVPADATAITGNLTVVGQTKAGYLSITKTSVANPTTSTLNFPVGDTRANGVSVPLNGTGALWIVYKAAAGGTTHVILDVTGYYREDPAGLLFYPLTPGRVMDSRTTLLSGLSGPFAASSPRRLDIGGHWGAPLSAEAVTGNLTVVGQQAGGYVSATLNSEVNPTTSVLNFPLGDTRANGVTLPLNAGGRSWFVYKAPTGKLTHLILDLSGYFD